MIGHTRHRTALFVLAVWVAVALLAACGDATKKSTSPATNSGQAPAVAGLNTCATCHTEAAAEWLASGHANMNPGGNLGSPGDPTLAQISGCTANCHDPNADSAKLTAGYTGNTARPVVGCEACHGGGSLHAEAGGAGPIGFTSKSGGSIGATAVSAQFNTCTTCHELLDSSGTGTTATAAHDAGGSDPLVVPEGVNANKNSITDTHFAKTLSTFGGANRITGYAMDFAALKVCTDCHNPHGKAAVNQEWSQSAHADRSATDAGYLRGAWARSNWSCNGTSTAASCGTSNFSDRRYCQRCHTTDGFIAFADALRAGDTEQALKLRQADLQFTFSAGTGTSPGTYTPLTSAVSYATDGWKPQMLKCNACHTDYKGTLRNPGPFPAVYDYYSVAKNFTGPDTVIYVRGLNQQYPDALGSNICVACHSGRESGETIKALNSNAALAAFAFNNKAYITPHELTGAGTVFGATGFEYAGRSYADDAFYRHSNIGTPKEPGTGSNGPCVGCHMSRPNKNGNHLFLPISRAYTDPTGTFISKQAATITGIASEVCFKCHGPNDNVILDMVKEQKALYAEAIEAVVHVAEGSGYFWNEGSYLQRDGTYLRSGAGAAGVVNGSAVVTAATITGSTFGNWQNADIAPGDQFRFDSNGTWYSVASVGSATQLTLAAPYTGVTATGRYSFQKAGTVNVTTGSTLVTGVTVSWIRTGVAAGSSAGSADHFRVDSDGTWYQITARTGNTLTLAVPYAGPPASGAGYTIRRARSGANAIVNWLTPPDTDVSGNGTGKNNMGAAFNLYLLESDPAGYVHNRYYMKRLMYDSIDWFDDNQLNYSTGMTLNAVCGSGPAPVWCPGAVTYLLPNGVLGIPAERP